MESVRATLGIDVNNAGRALPYSAVKLFVMTLISPTESSGVFIAAESVEIIAVWNTIQQNPDIAGPKTVH